MIKTIVEQHLKFAGLPIVKHIKDQPIPVSANQLTILNAAAGFVGLDFQGQVDKVYNQGIDWLENNIELLEPIDKGGIPMFAFDGDGEFIYGICIFQGDPHSLVPEERETHCFVKFIKQPRFNAHPWNYESHE